MTTVHLFQMDTLKREFQEILQLQTQLGEKQTIMKDKLNELKELYGQLVKKNNKKIFLFCLDSFYFQYKTLSAELDNIQRYIIMINNRVYGDYYKLYHIILLELSASDQAIQKLLYDFKKYTPYKDLDPFHEYKTSDVMNIHADILRVVNHIYLQFLKKEQTIVHYRDATTPGMSVGNFIHTLSYENALQKEQLMLYVNYLTFFHKSQHGYLFKLLSRARMFQTEIEEDILSNRGQLNTKNMMTSNVGSLESHLQEMETSKKIEIEDGLAMLEREMHNSETEQSNIEIAICDYKSSVDNTPVVENPGPVVENPAPVVENPTPVVENPGPVVENPGPVVENPAPVVENPAPVVENPAPVVDNPAPVAENPAPVVENPQPIEESAQLTKSLPNPVIIPEFHELEVNNPEK